MFTHKYKQYYLMFPVQINGVVNKRDALVFCKV